VQEKKMPAVLKSQRNYTAVSVISRCGGRTGNSSNGGKVGARPFSRIYHLNFLLFLIFSPLFFGIYGFHHQRVSSWLGLEGFDIVVISSMTENKKSQMAPRHNNTN
jgi:hypothetical protein